MIKVNLLPVKKKKKSKPLPMFMISMIGITLAAVAISLYLVYFFNSRLSDRKMQVAANDQKIAELQEKIKEADEFEKRNAIVQKQTQVIEQLTKNRLVPVKILDSVSSTLPIGVWLTNLEMNGPEIHLSCIGFNNNDVVNYVNNLKNSALFVEVYLLESVQEQISGVPVYKFRLKFMVKT